MRCFSLITRDDPGKKNKQTCKNVVTGANSSWLSPNFCYLFNNGIASHVFKVAKTNNSQFTARHPDLSLGQWRMFILLWYISAAKDYPTEIGNADLHNHLACPWVHENYHCSLNSMTYCIHIATYRHLEIPDEGQVQKMKSYLFQLSLFIFRVENYLKWEVNKENKTVRDFVYLTKILWNILNSENFEIQNKGRNFRAHLYCNSLFATVNSI